MSKMKKKTPKSSNKKSKRKKESQENTIRIGIFIIFIAVVAYLFYFLNVPSYDVVAVVNGDEISREQLDWWYKISILPEYRDIITKEDFLATSLIPQEILMQKAERAGIKATKDDVEKLLGLYIIENGLSLDEFEKHLKSRGLTIEDIKSSFETRAVITKLLEKENIISIENDKILPDAAGSISFQEYLDTLTQDSEIEIFPENINKLILSSFEETGDELCNEKKPIIRMYTTSKCEVCGSSAEIFTNSVKELVENEKIEAFHWSLDTGDNLLTLKKEEGLPEEEVAIFKKYSPNKLVPTTVIGCKYKRIGSLGPEQEAEFKAILKSLVGE